MLLRVLFLLLILPFAYFFFFNRIPEKAIGTNAKETFADVSQQLNEDGGEQVSNSPSMKSHGGFGAQLFLTEDEGIFSDWDRSKPPGISTVEKARRGVPIFTVLILAGMGTDSADVANVMYDVVIRKPDGSTYGDDKGLIGWNREHQGPPNKMQLAEGYMGIVIEETDPSGIYQVEATVHDRVKNEKLVLETSFRVDD